MSPLLKVQNLTIWTKSADPVPLIEEISFSIHPRETVALVGESGAGKTITALALLNLLPRQRYQITSGQVLFEGDNLLSLPKERMRQLRGAKIGFIFQDPETLNPVLTVRQQIYEAITLHEKIKGSDLKTRALALIKQVHLQPCILDKLPHQLSGGEKQRVLIAIGIAPNPKLLIADEPTASLDIVTRQEILSLLLLLKKELNISMLLISHDDKVVRHLADRLYFMDKGRMTARPAPPELPHLQIPLKTTQAPFVSVDGLSIFIENKSKHTLVEGVNLDIFEGETLGITGQTGAGKTSFALGLMGLYAHEGHILLDRHKVKDLSDAAHYVFQQPASSFNPRFRVSTLLEESARYTPHKGMLILEALQAVGLDESIQDRYPDELSGGQAQRIAVAQALVRGMPLMLFDEPTAALDFKSKWGLVQLLSKLQQDKQKTYVIISHDWDVLKALSHRIALFHEGKLVEVAPTNTLLTCPQHPYAQLLIESLKVRG